MEFADVAKATHEDTAKRKHKNMENSDGTPEQSRAKGAGQNPPDQKLRKKSKHLGNVSQIISQTSPTEESDNKSKTNETTVAEVDNAKKRKRKRRDTESEPKASQSKAKEEEVIQQLPTKKRKNRTEFADPREDPTLNNQSRRALEYTFMQMNKPSKWKFNKARQNWIIRNLWLPEVLPERYFSLTLKYLSKIQGGSRLKLVEEARTILHPKDLPPDPEKPPVKEPDTRIETTASRVKPVPGPLISTDLTPGPLLGSEPISATNEPSSADAKVNALTEIKKTRAQKLLEVLSSNTENA